MTIHVKKLLTGIIVTLSLMSCGGDGSNGNIGDAGEATADSMSLRIAVMPTLDCLPIYVAQEAGLFAHDGLSVSLISFTAHMDCDTAIIGGTVHAMPTDLVRAERLIKQGTPLHYATVTTLGWQLVTAKTARIRKLAQMDDKMLAMTRYSATAMLADQLVDSAKLQTERVFRIQVNDVLVRLNMMETGTMEAMLLPEPQATVARLMGCNTLYDTTADSLVMGVIAFSQEALKDSLRRRQMKTFLKVYDEACDSINTLGLDHYRNLIATRCHVQQDVADSLTQQHPVLFSHTSLPRQRDLDLARKWLGYLSESKSLSKKDSKSGSKKKRNNQNHAEERNP